MNRRHFIQALVSAPLLSRFLLGSKKTQSASEIHLVSDNPHQILPLLLEEMKKYGLNYEKKFAFLNSYPNEKQMTQELQRQGWIFSPLHTDSDLSISFRSLKHKIRPSFTMAKEGGIWDIRSKRLLSLWKQINKEGPLSSCLTIAYIRGSKPRYAGKSFSVFSQGQRIDSLALNVNRTKLYKGKAGEIVISVNNGKVWVNESSCRHKICCLTPPIAYAGERIICAPNRLLVEIDRSSLVDTSIG
jgi:hypothetical protein